MCRVVCTWDAACVTSPLPPPPLPLPQECATGKYPYPESGAQIVMVMTLTEGEPPLPPRDGTFTDEFVTFLSQCIALKPEARASAMDLLRSDW